ncbi:hypothetical protein CPB84DRAFT_1743696 [Gymnopilus junonius]|uniref:F-box domain-containing protein n=1 Tax=Gymnopilus junonius TaxID=109634 RepID=A0A9P5NZX7_GYMJU|nr:hypothetical protein CPB84DRAFT_1743696 [Gymnopilus junonius]
MSIFEDYNVLMNSPQLAGPDELAEVPSSQDNLNAEYRYPGGHAQFSSQIFLSIYEEEEAIEQPTWRRTPDETVENVIRPTIYHLLRLFDSIRGFHRGYLDLSGRHPQRYYTLQSQWNKYLCSFLGLETEIRPLEDLNTLGTDTYHVVFNPERWRRFLLKWRLPESISYTQLLRYTQKVLRDLRQHPVPQFQTLRLTDLPTEVLDNVITLSSIAQAKAFSLTCHTLNAIAQRHIFRTWRMNFYVPPHISPFNVEFIDVNLPLLAHHCRKDLERNVAFLRDTPHVNLQIQRLVLTDEWWVSRRAHPHENNPWILGIDFLRSVTQIFGSVFKSAPRLSTLVLCNLEMNLDLARKISEISTLHTLELHLCHVSRMARKKLISDASVACHQIANLHIYMDSTFSETHTQWYGLLLCPRIRTLSVVQFGVGAFPTPDATFWSRCRLDNLERLALENIDLGDLAELTKFFASSNMAGAQMTRFKLHMDWGIPDSEVLGLLLAIHNSVLEVVVVEGLAEGQFTFFELIAEQFPQLIALTVVRRQNSNQHLNKLAIWPHASWEYAPYFQGFKSLRHFCWNFRTEYWDATPTTLLAFESNFQVSSSTMSSFARFPLAQVEADSFTGEVPYFLDSHWMALPFVAHCSTLESFALMDSTIDMVCHITRPAPANKPILAPNYYPMHSAIPWNDQQWNTTSSHWPVLLPRSG